MNYSELLDYLKFSIENFDKLNSGNVTEDEKKILVYEIYANYTDLQDELKHIKHELRLKYKLKDEEVKKWMKET